MNEHDISAEWLQVAYDDYDAALYLFQKPHRKPVEIICYHCQQSAEKSLKAFLCASGVEIQKTHDTGILCHQCIDIDDSFAKFLEPCEELAIYATETRYPVRIEIDEAAAMRNLEQALEIYSFVSGIIKSPISDIEIRKLTPELADDYTHFFDTTPHNDTGKGEKCYCLSWCGDNVYHNGGEYWYPASEERRAHAIKRVKHGDIQGYLAYRSDEIVGWCNANAKANCQEAIKYFRSAGVPVDEYRAGEKTKSVFCFVIAPKMRRMGAATKLLEFICQDAAADGFDIVEAYTNIEFTQDGFKGPLEMYEKCGFSRHAEQDGKVVVQKLLN